jgi:hypothetical protein
MEAYLLSKLPFPAALIPSILEYKLRPDWKTCREHESNLIKELQRNVIDQLYRVFDIYDIVEIEYYVLDDYREWSLFGMNYVLYWLEEGGMDRYGRVPRIRPLEKYYRSGDDYLKWYTQSFMCYCFGI